MPLVSVEHNKRGYGQFVFQKGKEILIYAACFWSEDIHCHMLTHADT